MVTTVTDILMKLGINETVAASLAPTIIMRPRVTGFLSQPVIILLKHIQRYAGLPVSGVLTEATERFIIGAAGEAWVDSTWAEVAQDIIIYDIASKGLKPGTLSAYHGFSGLDGLPATSWCSVQNPQPGCTALTEVCKPMDANTLAIYKDLQTQVNRLLARLGRPLVRVDGRIGSETRKGINTALNANYSSCDEIAERADEVAAALRAQADAAGAAVVPPPPTSKPSIPAPSGEILHPQEMGIMGGGNNLLIALLVGGSILYLFSDQAKGKKVRRAPRRRTALNRRRRAAR